MIGVDTSVVHLAGALGKPVWSLIANPPDFRWMRDREDSPWYPTMRLFRQQEPGDWAGVIVRVKAELEKVARLGAQASASVECERAGIPTAETALRPVDPQRPALAGTSTIAETVVGIVQYFPDQQLIGESIQWYGEYLQPQLNLLAQMIRPGTTVMEVGCGIGMHVLAMAPMVGISGQFFLCESRPLFQQVLRQNLGANGVGNITVMKRAVGGPKSVAVRDFDHVEAARAEDGSSGPASLSETIDELRLEALHWLKINEVADAIAVLQGAAATLWRLRPNVFAAACDEEDMNGVVECIRDFGYQCWKVETTYFNPDNFNRREADRFAGRVALAVLAIPEEAQVGGPLDGCVKLT